LTSTAALTLAPKAILSENRLKNTLPTPNSTAAAVISAESALLMAVATLFSQPTFRLVVRGVSVISTNLGFREQKH
jgi:hypothetical protein